MHIIALQGDHDNITVLLIGEAGPLMQLGNLGERSTTPAWFGMGSVRKHIFGVKKASGIGKLIKLTNKINCTNLQALTYLLNQ